MPKFVIPKEIKFLSILLPESSTKDKRPFSKINSPPISVFNSVANLKFPNSQHIRTGFF
jgi:hypothetical protein